MKKLPAGSMALVLVISALCMLAGCGIKNEDITSSKQLNEEGRTIGVTSDTADYKLIEKNFPKAEIAYFNNDNTAYESVRQGKIDAYVFTVVNMQTAINKGLDGVMLLDETLGEGHDGAVAVSPETKIPDLKDKINKFLKEMRDDGTLDEMEERWMIKGEEEMPDIPEADHPELHLVVGTAGTSPPFAFYSGTELVGYDIELAKRFAASIGADIEFKVYDYDGIVAAAQAGDVDCIFANLFATPERRKEIEFSDPTYNNAIGIMVKSSGGTKAPEYKSNASGGGAFIASLKESFNKTFVREDRWKLFLSGILTTLLITILSIIFGTILGFIIFMICRRGGRAANLITRFCIWLINGMPVVVLLMILYYIIFSKAGLSGVTVSVIAFTMIFTAAVFSMVKAGVGTIDIGQTEAAYSLGYTDIRAFFRIVMPQALPHIMPTYKAQITALIKATAVVGYIAVQDLTKMGDIVRSRTYEAFFPLIAVAVIYFILAAILTYFVNRIELRTDPKRRTIEEIKRAVEED